MKQAQWPLLALAAFFFLAGTSFCVAQERITRFQSFIAIRGDSSITVKEVITVVGEGRQIKHGIYRDFPTMYQDNRGGTVRTGFDVVKVLRDGREIPFSIKSVSGGKRVYLGSNDELISRGTHVFELTYISK
jgi:hypothetical protein